jgi:hypothetical protein
VVKDALLPVKSLDQAECLGHGTDAIRRTSRPIASPVLRRTTDPGRVVSPLVAAPRDAPPLDAAPLDATPLDATPRDATPREADPADADTA